MKLYKHFVPISSDFFTYDGDSKIFVSEASDLGTRFTMRPLYDDACDVGFALMSASTAQVAIFSLDRVETDTEGETIAWYFTPITESIKENKGLEGTKVIIYND